MSDNGAAEELANRPGYTRMETWTTASSFKKIEAAEPSHLFFITFMPLQLQIITTNNTAIHNKIFGNSQIFQNIFIIMTAININYIVIITTNT